MDSAALTVKPDEPVRDGASDPAAGPERRHGGEWYGPARIGVKPGPDRLRSSRLGGAGKAPASTASEQAFRACERGAESGNAPSVVQARQP